MTFWEKYENLCKNRGISPSGSEMVSLLGVSSAGITYWKQNNTAPKKFEIYEKLSKYFEVDTRYLLGYTDSPHGEDIVESMTEKLIDSGVIIDRYNDGRGAGEEYVLTYNGRSFNYQDHEFKALCVRLRTLLNDTELVTVEKFCKETFGSDLQETTTPYGYTSEENDLITRYRKLSPDGKIKVRSALIDEERLSK